MNHVVTTIHRSAELCRQMLAYSGRASLSQVPIDLATLIEEMGHLLKISVSKKCILNMRLERKLPKIQADPGQIRQVILNLITNASEAIGDRSGVISITLGATHRDESYLKETELHRKLKPGLYLHLEVTDTGIGMDPETQARIFEPFFTTKTLGRGLGLAAVLGILRAHGGAMKVYSEKGQGTSFKLIFPALEYGPAEEGEADRALGDASTSPFRGWNPTGTILLADDEETLRGIAGQVLEKFGFKVLLAVDGHEAVEIYRRRHSEIDLVILDLTMPHLDGGQAFSEIRRLNPEARVILASGYSEEDVGARFSGKRVDGVLQKPFSIVRLREILEPLFPNRKNPEP